LKKDKAIKYYFFYIKFLFSEDIVEVKNNCPNSNSESSEVNSRVVNFNEENKRIKGKKMTPIQYPRKIPTLSPKPNNNKENTKSALLELESYFDFNNTIIFSSISKDLVNKWVCVLNYFIKK
jgi:hypothetical protein